MWMGLFINSITSAENALCVCPSIHESKTLSRNVLQSFSWIKPGAALLE